MARNCIECGKEYKKVRVIELGNYLCNKCWNEKFKAQGCKEEKWEKKL